MKSVFKSTTHPEVNLEILVYNENGVDVATVIWPDENESEHSVADLEDFANVFQSAANQITEFIAATKKAAAGS